VPEKLKGELKVEMTTDSGPFPVEPGRASVTLNP
jgi:hypothetical protein